MFYRRLITGLRTEIVLNVAVLMIAATAMIGFVVLKVSEQAALDQKSKSATVILNSIQNSLKYAETGSQPADVSIQGFIDIFMENSSIAAILVVDRNMRIIAHSSGSELGKLIHDAVLLKAVKEKNVTTTINGGSVSISSPLYLRNEIFGGIKVVLSGSDIREVAGKSQRLILFYVALNSVILIVFGSILLSRTIVRPIDELVLVTEAVATGDLSQRVKVKRLNEIGALAESFNRMTDRLKEGKEALEANIRQLKTAQDEVIRAEKMATVGRLAAGIAHEIGNPLGAILGYTDILQKGADKENAADYLRRIETEIQRINRIVKGLLDYARPGEFELVEINVKEILESSLDLVCAQKGFERIDIKLNLNDVPVVTADPHQLQQVLVNLFINASDAMPEGGTLTVESGVRKGTVPDLRAEQGEAVESGLSPKKSEWVEISVADTGIGMSDDEIRKIFDPFYTTKEPGRGTGLGLAICMRIIESFGGRIEVESRKGEGSRFSVLLPVKLKLN